MPSAVSLAKSSYVVVVEGTISRILATAIVKRRWSAALRPSRAAAITALVPISSSSGDLQVCRGGGMEGHSDVGVLQPK